MKRRVFLLSAVGAGLSGCVPVACNEATLAYAVEATHSGRVFLPTAYDSIEGAKGGLRFAPERLNNIETSETLSGQLKLSRNTGKIILKISIDSPIAKTLREADFQSTAETVSSLTVYGLDAETGGRNLSCTLFSKKIKAELATMAADAQLNPEITKALLDSFEMGNSSLLLGAPKAG